MDMKRIILAMIALAARVRLGGPASRTADRRATSTGRIIDEQGAAVPGVTVTARNTADRLHADRRHATPKASIG